MANELVIRGGVVSKGDITLPIRVENGTTYTVADDDYSIVLSGSSDATVTIPSSATTLTGKIFVFKKFYCCFFKYIYVGFLNSKYSSYFSNRFIFLIMINVITMSKSI